MWSSPTLAAFTAAAHERIQTTRNIICTTPTSVLHRHGGMQQELGFGHNGCMSWLKEGNTFIQPHVDVWRCWRPAGDTLMFPVVAGQSAFSSTVFWEDAMQVNHFPPRPPLGPTPGTVQVVLWSVWVWMRTNESVSDWQLLEMSDRNYNMTTTGDYITNQLILSEGAEGNIACCVSFKWIITLNI